MFRLKARPYQLLLFAAAILLMAAPFMGGYTIDMHLYDTYYVIAGTHVFMAMAVLLLLLWLIYLLTHRLLFSRWLAWLHVVAACAATLCLAGFLVNFHVLQGAVGLAPSVCWLYRLATLPSIPAMDLVFNIGIHWRHWCLYH